MAGNEAFGDDRLILALLPVGITEGEMFGVTIFALGGAVIRPGGIGSGEAIGVPTLIFLAIAVSGSIRGAGRVGTIRGAASVGRVRGTKPGSRIR
jgi:hypothetical protein